MIENDGGSAARFRPVPVAPEGRHEFVPVRRVPALVESNRGLLEVFPGHALRQCQSRGNGSAEIDQPRIVRIRQAMPAADHGGEARQTFRVAAADVEEFHRLTGAQIRPRDRIVHVKAPSALVQDGASHKVIPRQPRKQPPLEFLQGVRHHRGCHGREGLLKTKHERIVSDPAGH